MIDESRPETRVMSDGPSLASGIRPTWVEISVDAIQANLRELRNAIGPDVQVFASLKRNAGGCGSIGVATALEEAGVDGFALGNPDDALTLRDAGVRRPILLYPSCLPETAPLLAEHGVMPTISTKEEVSLWAAAAQDPLDVFLKIDIGGYRAGAFPRDAIGVARAIRASDTLRLAGVYGHVLATYTGGGPAEVRNQLQRFVAATDLLAAAGIDASPRMVASSAIVAGHPDMDLDAVDPGRLLMGHHFALGGGRSLRMRPAVVAIKSRLVSRKPVPATGGPDDRLLFGIREGMIIGLAPIGHGDGLPRNYGTNGSVIVRGRRVPILAPLHSEMMRVDLTDVPDAEIGDEIVLLGEQLGEVISLSEIEAAWSMDSVGVFGAIKDHVTRVYVRDDSNYEEDLR